MPAQYRFSWSGRSAAPDLAESTNPESLSRMLDHLKANNLDPETTKTVVGPLLKIDAQNERFVGSESKIVDAANKNVNLPSHLEEESDAWFYVVDECPCAFRTRKETIKAQYTAAEAQTQVSLMGGDVVSAAAKMRTAPPPSMSICSKAICPNAISGSSASSPT